MFTDGKLTNDYRAIRVILAYATVHYISDSTATYPSYHSTRFKELEQYTSREKCLDCFRCNFFQSSILPALDERTLSSIKSYRKFDEQTDNFEILLATERSVESLHNSNTVLVRLNRFINNSLIAEGDNVTPE